MMPKKKKKTIIIVSIIMLILILAITFILLYLKTDMFKSNQTLFVKYLGKNTENIDEMYRLFNNSEFEEKLKTNKYTSDSQFKINYVKGIGTTSESTENNINKLKLKFNSEVDATNNFNHQNIEVLNNDQSAVKVEYVQNSDTYAIKLSDLFQKYILVENSNLKDLFKKLGYTDEQLQNIPDKFESSNLKDIFKFTDEEKETLKNRYINVFSKNVSEQNFSKQSNQTIEINGQRMKANGYILKLTKEQLNTVYLQILEVLKQDEMILSKIDNIQSEIMANAEQSKLKDAFVEEIDEMISNINENNIGQEETSISIYESNGKTVSTMIKTTTYEISLDWIINDTEAFAQLIYQEMENDINTTISLNKKQDDTNLEIVNTEADDVKTITFVDNKKYNDNNGSRATTIRYENGTNRLEANIEQNIKIVENFKNEINFNSDNSIKLNTLDQDQLQEVMNIVTSGVTEKIQSLSEVINQEDIYEILIGMNILKEEEKIEGIGVTETERNRFNSKFELLPGEELRKEDIIKIIDIIKDNLIDMEVASNTVLKLRLDQNNNNNDIVTTLTNYIEKNDSNIYDVSIEYDEGTGLIKYIILTIVQK